MDEEDYISIREPICYPITERHNISVCKCLRDDDSTEKIEISVRKQQILTTVARTECYLRERRIPELIRFFLTKVIAQSSEKPIAYLETLLNDCMLYRAGHGLAPVLYEQKHLEAVVKSFDPGHRGWLSAGQLRRAYTTLGLTLEENIDVRIPIETVLISLKESQEIELFNLLSAGLTVDESSENTSESCI